MDVPFIAEALLAEMLHHDEGVDGAVEGLLMLLHLGV